MSLPASGPRRSLLLLLFFLSGLSALVLEVVWLRQLGLFYGTTARTTALLLANFMVGLGVGGSLGGRLAGRLGPRSMRAYGLLELGIGAAALVLPRVFPLAERLLGVLPVEGTWGGVLAAVTVSCLLLPPTILMGATFPLVIRAASAQEAPAARQGGMLYAANTAGAVTGTLMAASFLFPGIGISGTSMLVFMLNALIGIVALTCPVHGENTVARPSPASGPGPASPGEDARMVLWLAGTLGFLALALEVVGTRILVLFAGTTVYAFAAMLSVFLLGIALGSVVAGPAMRWSPVSALRTVGWLSLVWSAFVVMSMALVGRIPHLYLDVLVSVENGSPHPLMQGVAVASLLLLVPAMCGGASFVLLLRASTQGSTPFLTRAGTIYALNTIGAAAGSLASGFLLIPIMGLQWSLILLACSGALFCALPVLVVNHELDRNHRGATSRRVTAPAGLCAVIISAAILAPSWDPLLLSSGVYWRGESYVRQGPSGQRTSNLDVILAGRRSLFHSEGVGATVDVFESENRDRQLAIDGKVVASTNFLDVRLQYMLGALGVLLHEDPSDVLIIGMGTGMTAGAASFHPGVRRLTVVEITPGVIEAARFFERWNGAIHSSPGVDIHMGDGAWYVRQPGQSYDVIASDPIHPFSAGSSTLYSREHFANSWAKLRPDGVMGQWLPLYQLTAADLKTVVRTFTSVFPESTLWFTGTDCVLLGFRDGWRRPGHHLSAALASPRFQEHFGRYGLAHPDRLLATFLMGPEALREFGGDASLTTVDWPVLEFRAPLAMEHQGVQGGLRSLLAIKEEFRFPGAPAVSESVRAASRRINQALAGSGSKAALGHLRAAVSLDPGDPYPRYLYLRQLVAVPPGAVPREAWIEAGRMAFHLLPEHDLTSFWSRLVNEFSRGGRGTGLLELLREAQERFTGGSEHALADLRALEALYLLANGRDDEALATLHSTSHLSQEAASRPLLLARYLAGRLTGDARVSDGSDARISGRPWADPEPRVMLARLLFHRGKLQKAETVAQEVLRRNPRSIHAMMVRANVAMTQGRFEEANEIISGAMAVHPGSPDLLRLLADLLEMTGESGKRLATLELLTRRAPNDAAAWNELGQALRQAGDEVRAEEALHRAADLRRSGMWGLAEDSSVEGVVLPPPAGTQLPH